MKQEGFIMDIQSFEKSLDQAAEKVAQYAREGARRDGVPFYFRDAAGRRIKEYPDGHQVEIIQDGDYGKEIPLV